MTLDLSEEDRQMTLLAFAHLSVERPGWDDALNRIALRIDNVENGRAVMYERYRDLCERHLRELKSPGKLGP